MMNLFKLGAIVAPALLVACAQQPPRTEETAPAQPPSAKAPAPKPRVVVRAPVNPKVLPRQELSRSILFKLLLAEVALQRGQNNIAVQQYLELSRETRDPRIAQRATEIAWSSRFMGVALETAGIWLQADPESQQARQIMAALLVSQARLADAQPYLEKSLASDPEHVGQGFLQLLPLLGRSTDKDGVLALLQNLAKPYASVPEAHFAVAQAASNAGQNSLALAQAREAVRLRPDWEQAALLQGQLLQKEAPAEALEFYGGYLKQHPKAMDVRLGYARLLVNEKQYAEARGEFEQLLKEFPNSPEVTMAVALLSLQLNDYDAAEARLLHALETNYKNPDEARFYLGRTNEERKRDDEALKWYASVTDGSQYVLARSHYAGILARQGRLDEARKFLQESGRNAEERLQFVQAEAQLLRDANEAPAAFDVLKDALAKSPDSTELLYDQAMVAEKLDRIDVVEANLRRVIKLRPDHAHAYNALGYTFADRNIRLPEAYDLIEQALKLAPNDGFILDSMGWVLHRMGQNDTSLTFLKRAFSLRPDAEIAAHLGEVLWAMGEQAEARKVWAGALKENPGNEALLAIVKKYTP
jgi:tetratricopeptide (TPR) repeat protein